MKKLQLITRFMVVSMTLLFSANLTVAQEYSDPVAYMSKMGERYNQITKDMWDYTRAIAHDKSARKIEKRRRDILKTLTVAIDGIKAMPGYEGYTDLRDTTLVFLQMNYDILNLDYAKIVDMEEVAEQSYDLMEAYLMAQDLAGEKMKNANDRLKNAEQAYADKFNITLTEGNTEIGRKLEKANEVYDYYNVVYLIFFKSYKQEAYLLAAMEQGDISGMEQNNNALLATAEEGLNKLKELDAYQGDMSVVKACKNMLEYYKDEAEGKVPGQIEFIMLNDNFNKVKEAFEAIPERKRTQKDVDEYNKGIEELNAGVNAYNQTNAQLNADRSRYLDTYNAAAKEFTERHIEKR